MAQQIKKKFLSPELISQVDSLEQNVTALQTSKADKSYVDQKDAALASDISDLEGVVQGNFDLQQSDIDGLRSDVDANSSAISSEVSARQAADASLQSQINNLLSNVDPASLDSLSEVVAAFEAADSNLNNAISSLASSASSALQSEQSARIAADQALQGEIDAEEQARAAADSTLQNNIQSEAEARIAADALKVNKSGDTLTGSLYWMGQEGDATWRSLYEATLDKEGLSVYSDTQVPDPNDVTGFTATERYNLWAKYGSISAQKDDVNGPSGFKSFNLNLDGSGITSTRTVYVDGVSTYVPNMPTKDEQLVVKKFVDDKIVEAKAYTDSQIAAIPPVDLSSYETISNVDSKDAANLVEAKAYTDLKISQIPAVDLSGYYSKSEVDAKDAVLASDISDLEVYAQEIRVDHDDLDAYAQDIRSDVDGHESRIAVLEAKTDGPSFADEHKLMSEQPSLAYLDLNVQVKKIMSCAVGRAMIHESIDFTVSTVNGKTRLTFIGSLVNPTGEEAIDATDMVHVVYAY